MIHSYYVILIHNKKEWIIDTCSKVDELQINYAEWKKPISKRYLLHKPVYVIFMKWYKWYKDKLYKWYRNKKQFSGCPRLGIGAMGMAIKR